MILRSLTIALLSAGLVAPAMAKKPVNPEFAQAQKEMSAAVRGDSGTAPSTVGDVNSFGRAVHFMGTMQSGVINITNDCTPDPANPLGPDDHCVVANPAPALTTFNFTDVGRMVVPAKSANSLFCHWQTPFVVYSFNNSTGVYQPNARFIVTPTYTIQNPVLNDPSLIDPGTGLPFGGSFTVGLSDIRHSRSLQAGEHQVERDNDTRVCLGGMVSKQGLIDGYGLTDAQATNFFKNDTVITMNLQGSVQMVDFASIIYGLRLTGD